VAYIFMHCIILHQSQKYWWQVPGLVGFGWGFMVRVYWSKSQGYIFLGVGGMEGLVVSG
jgi:hypothetical protein